MTWHVAVPSIIIVANSLSLCYWNKTSWYNMAFTSCKQQGKQHEEHLRGLISSITCWPKLSIIFIVKGLDGPQQLRVQQSFSSAAKYTLCPKAFFISYLLLVSKPVNTERKETELFICSKAQPLSYAPPPPFQLCEVRKREHQYDLVPVILSPPI